MRAEPFVHHGGDGIRRFTTAAPPIPKALRAHVRDWIGYAERTPGPCHRRELPGPQVVVIFDLGAPIRVSESGAVRCDARFPGGFMAGLDDTFSCTEHDGEQTGVQLSLSPLAAHALFRVPQSELARRVIALGDLLPALRPLSERLANATSWSERFQCIERELRRRLDGRESSRVVAWALERVERSGGRVRIGELCRYLGYSRKHLNALFDEHVGLAPKLYAELVRFDRLVKQRRRRPKASWAELALDTGFADQAHLVREVRRFSGVTPSELADREPDALGEGCG